MEATEIMVKMVFDRWNALMQRCTGILDNLTDEQWQHEIAPGRNRVIYLVGHLIAVHDDMIPLLNFGDKLYPELYEPFLKSPDTRTTEIPSAQTLRAYWHTHQEKLTQQVERLKPEDWFEKHTAVSAEEFIKEPYRNKLNIIITRTSHLSYHIGQLALIK